MMLRRVAPFVVLFLVCTIYAVWLAYPIALVTADIGRHLMNGEVLLKAPSLFWQLTQTNFYTYTHTEYAAVNHHWLAGILFRLIFKMNGWTGLHLFYMALHLVALGIMVDAARRLGSIGTASVAALAALPLIGERFEIRPEGFAYLLFAIEFWMLIARDRRIIDRRVLWALPFLLLCWVNIHASFPVGLALLGAFLLRELLRNSAEGVTEKRFFLWIVISSVAATFVNPNGVHGFVEPFLIFRDPGYAVMENQSVFFLESLGVHKGSFLFLKIWTVLLVAGSFVTLRNRNDDLNIALLLFALAVTALCYMSARNLTLLGFALLPATVAIVTSLKAQENKHILAIGAIMLLAAYSCVWHVSEFQKRWIVVGLAPGANSAASFLHENNIHGPFFNDFDIAGYLIFHFFPEEKVFVSNVPEAQPPSFFRDVYIPMQQDNAVWRKQMGAYDFNAIVVYYKERTQWMPEFLRARLVDPEWAPVFADDSVLVFLRRSEGNADIIRRNEIPSSAFQFGS